MKTSTQKKTRSTRRFMASATLAAALFTTVVLPVSASTITSPSQSLRQSQYQITNADENVFAATSWDELRYDNTSKDTLISEGFSSAQINALVASAHVRKSIKPIDE